MRESIVLYFSGIVLNGFLFIGATVAEFEWLAIVTAIAMLLNFYFMYKSLN